MDPQEHCDAKTAMRLPRFNQEVCELFEIKSKQKWFKIHRDDVWKIACNIEKQGGNKEYAADSNRILEKVTEEKMM